MWDVLVRLEATAAECAALAAMAKQLKGEVRARAAGHTAAGIMEGPEEGSPEAQANVAAPPAGARARETLLCLPLTPWPRSPWRTREQRLLAHCCILS